MKTHPIRFLEVRVAAVRAAGFNPFAKRHPDSTGDNPGVGLESAVPMATTAVLTLPSDSLIFNYMKPHFKSLCLAALFSCGSLFTGCAEDSAVAAAAESNAARESSGVGKTATTTNAVVASNLSSSASTDVSSSATNEVVAVVPPAVPDDVKLSGPVEKILKMAQSGLGDSVLLAFIDTTVDPFDLDADEILYLTDVGLSEDVLAAMLKHDGQNRDMLNESRKSASALAAAQPAPPTNAPVGYSSVPVGPTIDQTQPQPYQAEPQVVISQPQTVVTYDTFYSSLSPYGSWLEVPAYGWCWQPTVAVIDAGWRPYDQRGRWLYSDCGWYWQSDYSWGWAPFHYGRWYRPAGRGWCWVPDRTWGPSWVSWRQSSGYYGWAPLPPAAHFRPGFGFSFHNSHVGVGFGFGLGHDAYTFVPAAHFYDRSPHRHAISRSESTAVYNRSTVVNNYVTGNNNRVINNGISAAHVASATRTEIHKVAIRDLPAGTRGVRPDRLRQQGNNLVVYRPSPEAVTRPSTLRPQTAEHITVNRGSAFGAPAVTSSPARGEAIQSRPVVSGSNPRSVSPRQAGLEESNPDLRPRPAVRGSESTRNPAGSSGIASRGQPPHLEATRSEPRSVSTPTTPTTITGNRASSAAADRIVNTDPAGTQRAIQSRPVPTTHSSEQAIVSRPTINSRPQMSRGNPASTGSSTVTPNVGVRSSEPARGSQPAVVNPIQSRPVPLQTPQVPPRTYGRAEPTRVPETVAIAPREDAPRYNPPVYTPPVQSRPAQQAPVYQPHSTPPPAYNPPAPVVSRPVIQSRPYTPPAPQPSYSSPAPTLRAAPTPAPAPQPAARAPAPAPQTHQPVQSRGRQNQN
jgi:hypothetical protein